MQAPKPRLGRINEVMQRELAKLVQNKCRDPRLGFVTISAVEVAANLEFAKVYVTVLEDDKLAQSIEVLNNAAGFFRTELSKLKMLRIIPKLRFVYDSSIMQGKRIDALLEAL